jgi:hypothetical protein
MGVRLRSFHPQEAACRAPLPDDFRQRPAHWLKRSSRQRSVCRRRHWINWLLYETVKFPFVPNFLHLYEDGLVQFGVYDMNMKNGLVSRHGLLVKNAITADSPLFACPLENVSDHISLLNS